MKELSHSSQPTCSIPSLSRLDPQLIYLTATGLVTPHDQGGAQQNPVIGKLKDLYRKTNILLVKPHSEPLRNEMLLHVFVMSPLYIKKGVVYFRKMSLA